MIYKTIFKRRFFEKMRSGYYLIDSFLELLSVIMILASVYYLAMGSKTNLNGISISEIITYLIFSIGLYEITHMNSDKLANNVFKGKFVFDFLKPYSYNGKVFSEAAADFLAGCITKIIPLLIISGGFRILACPSTIICGVLFIISLIIGAAIWCNIQFVFQLLGFWTKDVYNFFFCVSTAYSIICGGYILYYFLPERMTMILKATPFYYVIAFPMDIYFGKIDMFSVISGIVVSICYVVLLVLLGKVVFNAGKRKIQCAD